MYKLRRFINMYKMQIIVIAIAFLLFIIILQILNNITKNNMKENITKNEISKSVDYGKDYGVISKEKKESQIYEIEKNIMEEFANHCNNKKYEEAYNLLSNNCKEALYPNIEIFKTNYCDVNFERKKTYKFQLWNNDTYKVEIRNDAMSTGSYSDAYVQDYYTIVGKKLNIKGYIKRKNIDKENKKDNIVIKVKNIDIYVDYAKVNLTITNLDDKQILIDTQVNENSIVLKDNNNLEFPSNINEFDKEELKLNSKDKKDITLKFEVAHRENLYLTNVVFKKILKIVDAKTIGLGDSNTVQIDVEI